MAYLQRHLEKRVDPKRVLPGAESIIVVALSYNQAKTHPGQDPSCAAMGRVVSDLGLYG